MDAMFMGNGAASADGQFWESLGGAGKAASAAGTPALPADEDEDDLLAAFKASAPVDNSSYYPPPPSSSGRGPSPAQPREINLFDLDVLPSRDTPQPQSTVQDDDFDILGDLAKPVSELPPRPELTPSPTPPTARASSQSPAPPHAADPRDKSVAEIVEMGFSAEQARRALSHTGNGTDVQAAVSWLLEEAHKKSRPSSTRTASNEPPQEGRRTRVREGPSDPRRSRDNSNTPAWKKGSQQGEKDIGAMAVEVGGQLFKSANSLWNTSKKKIEKAVAEFQADESADPNMPKWMREQQIRDQLAAHGAQVRKHRPDVPEKPDRLEEPRIASTSSSGLRKQPSQELTDEAMMLEMGGGPPPRRKQREVRGSGTPSTPIIDERQIQKQRALEAAIAQNEKEMRQREHERFRAAAAIPDSAARRAKLSAESEAPVYVSRNRRRPTPASSSTSKPATPEPNLLADEARGRQSGPPRSNNPFEQDVEASRQQVRRPQPPTPAVTPPVRRQLPPQRPSIAVSPQALQSSASARQKGTEAFKRGDYGAAQLLYSDSLSPIPDGHTLRIILLTNRALCTIKLGDPKAAIADADTILQLIGPARGVGENISLDGVDKPMGDYWTKAITRRAEALEQLEKWVDARDAWETAVSAGVGGAVAAAGKRRCEAALKPKPAPSAAAPKPKPKLRPAAPRAPSGTEVAAVRALRDANAAAERTDAEKHALYDAVEARIGAWKAGKEGNLRALLAGLDTVLWEGSGWKKVGMGELLAPNKCKIVYMKGIAKVHPDKVSTAATTEQKMISKEVFSLLNEAWDKFKAENGL